MVGESGHADVLHRVADYLEQPLTAIFMLSTESPILHIFTHASNPHGASGRAQLHLQVQILNESISHTFPISNIHSQNPVTASISLLSNLSLFPYSCRVYVLEMCDKVLGRKSIIINDAVFLSHCSETCFTGQC